MSEDLNKLRELAESLQAGSAGFVRSRDFLNARHDFIDAANPAVILELFSRLQAAEERAEKLEGAMLNVQQQCENIVFNLRQADSVSLSNKEAVTIFDRMATTLRVAALKTEGA